MISASDVTRFREQGYLVVENLLDEAELRAVHEEYEALLDELYAKWWEQGELKVSPDGLSFWEKLDQLRAGDFDWYQPFDISLPHDDIADDTPMHFGPAVFDMVTNARILDTVEKLIGPEITSNPIQHVRIKPPKREVADDEIRAHVVATDWHQDMGVTLEEADETEFVTVWLAITDAGIENGCLQVAPGKRDKMLPHCARKQVGIADGFLSESETLPLPIKAGSAIIFHPMTPHASLDNESDRYRWSFDLRYNVNGQPTGRSHFPDFVVRSKDNPGSVLQDWQVWKKMWEDTRHHLAHTTHIAQHRWDANSPFCA